VSSTYKLDFPGIPYGTHETRHDLVVMLHHGASEMPKEEAMDMIASGKLGSPDLTRLPLVESLHEELSAQIARGISHITIKNSLYILRTFYSWCDKTESSVSYEEVGNTFRMWTEHLLQRVRIEKSLKNSTAYRMAKTVDRLLKPLLRLRLGLLPTTRLSHNSSKHKALGSDADKQNLHETFTFGNFLMDIVSGLSTTVLTGSLPIMIKTRTGHVLTEYCGLQNIAFEDSYNKINDKNKFLERRIPISESQVFEKRHTVVNLRIEAEILIFVAQTGMNLSQAAKLRKGKFRYKSHGDDILVYRVYKGRRGGEAEFCIFKEYSPIFKSYLDWLGELSDPEDERLFPFIYPTRIPVAGYFPRFQGISKRCSELGIKCFRPRSLRKTRINWLLRKSRNPDLVAEMAQHTKEVLLSVYEEPHHQSAATEISRFYRNIEPAVSAVGPGMCVAKIHPILFNDSAGFLTAPDCSMPAGCLFCEFQRDIDSEDHVWSLSSYKYLKMLELDRYTPPQGHQVPHPTAELINRLDSKLQYYSELGNYRATWVEESVMRMREGRFHPDYEGLIQLMELER
jgi:integrase